MLAAETLTPALSRSRDRDRDRDREGKREKVGVRIPDLLFAGAATFAANGPARVVATTGDSPLRSRLSMLKKNDIFFLIRGPLSESP